MNGGRRGRGRPARIDRDRIVQAALELDAAGEPLSMKAVADRLGVHAPNLYHHVGDRDSLAALVAAARIERVLDESWMPAPDADWRTWLRAFAHATRDASLTLPGHAEYFAFSGPAGRQQLDQIERLHEVLVDAGFDPVVAGRCVTLIGELVHINVRSVFMLRAQGQEPHRATISEILRDEPDALPLMRAAGHGDYDPDAQFAFDLDAVLAGLAPSPVGPGRG